MARGEKGQMGGREGGREGGMESEIGENGRCRDEASGGI